MLRPLLSLYFLGLALITFLSASGQREVSTYAFQDKTITHSDSMLTVTIQGSDDIDTVYIDVDRQFYIYGDLDIDVEVVEGFKTRVPEKYQVITQDNPPYLWQSNYSLHSLVGPYISYKEDYYAEGGAHPSYGTYLWTYDIEKKDSVDLRDLFDPEDLFDELKNDSLILKYLQIDAPKDLDDLVQNLHSECDFYFSDELFSRFAFDHIQGDKVAVRIGFSHGCEVMRGNYHEISIYLPIPSTLREWLHEAEAAGLLMNNDE